MKAWHMDDLSEDPRLEHHLTPEQFVSVEELAGIGVLYWMLDADYHGKDPKLRQIREERGYTYEDIVTVWPGIPDFDEKIRCFYEEHIHMDEEIRFCIDGSGYFDVRDLEDKWIRIWVCKGDLIVLPAGIYHRFTLDMNNYIKAMRLFIGEPTWTPYNRPQDENPARIRYVNKVGGVNVEAPEVRE